MKKLANFINGEYVEPKAGRYLDGFNPATGEVYAQIPDSDSTDVHAAVAAAKVAFPAWSETPAAERALIMNRIADGIERRLEEFARAESLDQGKPIWLARTVEVPRAVANFRFFAGAILHHEERVMDMDRTALNYTVRDPMGVAALISPWNLPLLLYSWKVAPAIAVGNTVVSKPSELTPLTASLMGEVYNEAGLPPGVANIVFGLGLRAGTPLTTHPDVPLISFTGGTATGTAITQAAAPGQKKVSLELGGKNAALIFEDANLAECVPTTIRSSFQNQGEICLCNSRIFVQRKIYKNFLDEFVKQAQALRVGDPADDKTMVGPLVSAAHRDKVISYIQLARQEGGEIICGGGAPKFAGALAKGYFVNPTVIIGLPAKCRVMQEEIFGPVVTITPFDTEEEAIALANNTQYGLSGSVWTSDLKRAHRVARAVHAGTIWVNTWMLRDLRVPFGGVKASGVGREGGEHSLDFYTELKTICVKL
ncbi:MAG: aldehyde dehydrogenase [Bacteriovoracia bacterium]